MAIAAASCLVSAVLFAASDTVVVPISTKAPKNVARQAFPPTAGVVTAQTALKAEESSPWDSLFRKSDDWRDFRRLKEEDAVKSSYPDFKNLVTGEALWIDDRRAPSWVAEKLEEVGPLWAIGMEKKKQYDDMTPLWDSLFQEPEQWLDFRAAKSYGKVVSKYPDFKRKDDKPLWVDSKGTPEDVAERLAEAGDIWTQAEGHVRTVSSQKELLWQDLFDRPSEWLDYRAAKASDQVNPRHPDFKRGDGTVLWLDSFGIPTWLDDRLRNEGNQWEHGEGRVSTGSNVVNAELEELWNEVFESPELWSDCRGGKLLGELKERFPDFKRIQDGKSLWITDRGAPSWLPSRLAEADEESPWPAYSKSGRN